MDETLNSVKEATKRMKRALLDFEINFWLNEKHTSGFIAYQIEKAVTEYLDDIAEIDAMSEEEVNNVTFYKEWLK